MKPVTLTISNFRQLKNIQRHLKAFQPLAIEDQNYLNNFLSQIPTRDSVLLQKLDTIEEFKISAWDLGSLNKSLQDWQLLFCNIPGFDFSPNCYLLDNDSPELLQQNIIMIAMFAPSLAYNSVVSNEAYEVRLKDDGTASFWFPSFEDAKLYPELFNFRGTWKEAYLLLIETLKKGWPMEEFPEELKPFLKK